MPFFSIIIPTYNRAEFLFKGIQTVLSQDFPDFEILVIDDGSTDNTAELMKEYISKDPRISYFHKANAERGAARNFGIANSRGEFLIFLDSDDEFLPGHLSGLKETIAAHPKINFFATKFDFNENGLIYKAPIDNLTEGIYDYRLLKRGNPFACNVCIRKNNPGLRLFPEDRKYASMEDWIFLFANSWSQDLFLSDKTTVRMNEHESRSMRFNKIIIEKRLLATEYILNHFSLYKTEVRKMQGYTAYFCAIHTYLDNERKKSVMWVLRSLRSLGVRSDLVSLLLKLLFGRKIIGKLKHAISHR
jgi:glycosyltransferase involved in cell wall biosynthesis